MSPDVGRVISDSEPSRDLLAEFAASGALRAVWALLVLAFLLALALTPAVRALALRRGWLDRPDGRRKAHTMPVPRLGGVAVYTAFLLACGAVLVLVKDVRTFGPEFLEAWRHLAVAGTAVMLVGLADDLRGVRPATKLLVQGLAAFYLYHHGYRVMLLSNPFGEQFALGLLSLPITLLWFIGASNAFNLIDGLDGLAAGIGLFATGTVFVTALINDSWEASLLAAALGGALIGFLRYNLAPASIFLGDCGSLFVGFALAAVAVRGSMKASTAVALLVPVLALALPLFDTSLAVARRLATGRSVFEADADHVHHRLLRRGFSPSGALIVLYVAAAVFAALALLTTLNPRYQVVGVVVIVLAAITLVALRGLTPAGRGAAFRLAALRASRPLRHAALVALRRRLEGAADLEQLWRELGQAAEGLGLRSLELRLEGGSAQRRGGGASRSFGWQAPRRVPERGVWSWTLPLEAGSRRLGELTLSRAALERDAPGESDLRAVLQEDLAAALVRVARSPASERETPSREAEAETRES